MWARLVSFEYLIYLGFLVILSRAFVIQMFPPSEKSLSQMASKQYHKPVKLGNYRGTILDRRGEPLAISVKTPSLAVNPRLFNPTKSDIKRLSRILGLPKSKIKKISRKTNYFSWLKRKVGLAASKKALNLEIPGVYKITEPSRFYPASNFSSHFVGKVDTDNKGIFGLERSLNKSLTGEAGKINAVRDGRGQLIFQNSDKVSPETSGHNVSLTIDHVIQQITSKALKNGVKEAGAKGGFAIVGNPHTGEIYAMASYPDYNPNYGAKFRLKNTRNKAISDIFEPGSVVKPFVIGRAIDLGVTTKDTNHDCEKSGVYRFGRNKIRDDHPKENLTTGGVLVHSSNICTFKIAKMIGKKELYELYKNLGYGTIPKKIGLPGLSRGRLSSFENWRDIRFANISFGQGHSVNGIDLLRSYNAIANGGRLIEPYLVDKIVDSSGKVIEKFASTSTQNIFKTSTATQLRNILHSVTVDGTARLARSEYYTTAGKTGTSEKYDPAIKAYSPTKRTASFTGFAPYNDPKITVIVVVDEPSKKPYYGGKWAAPIFREITDGTLQYLNISPDKVKKVKTISSTPIKKTKG
ncbi:penicillin-binding protein 2 [bacterium]|nr:penicillin-binding protein 2 [bacterium]